MMHDNGAFSILVDEHSSGMRLDFFVASRMTDCSRSLATDLIRCGKIKVHGSPKKPGYHVKAGDYICGQIPSPEPIKCQPEPIPLDIIHADQHLIILNKPPGLVVHQAPGHYSGTLVNALLYHFPELINVDGELRPGIVHRLDKDTSGVLIVAKDAVSKAHLLKQFQSRMIKKQYQALVYGEVASDSGVIKLAIGRHPVDRKRMSALSRKGREAETGWRVRERFKGVTLLDLDLRTGRTHQIRVHLTAINHPIVGDPVYGARKGKRLFHGLADSPEARTDLSEQIKVVKRQMLHAWRIRFRHPASERLMSFKAPIPPDMNALIEEMRRSLHYAASRSGL